MEISKPTKVTAEEILEAVGHRPLEEVRAIFQSWGRWEKAHRGYVKPELRDRAIEALAPVCEVLERGHRQLDEDEVATLAAVLAELKALRG